MSTELESAHPRSRGENDEAFQVSEEGGGSSPLTRGKPLRARGNHEVARLIPAHAGKTGRSAGRAPDGWAHPRSRGENMGVVAEGASAAGSSPLTRGKPQAGRPA